MELKRRRSTVHDVMNPTDDTVGGHISAALDKIDSATEYGEGCPAKRARPVLPPIETPDRCQTLHCTDPHSKEVHEVRTQNEYPSATSGIAALVRGETHMQQYHEGRYYPSPVSVNQNSSERNALDTQTTGWRTGSNDPGSCNSSRQSKDSVSALFHTCQTGPNAFGPPSTGSSRHDTGSTSSHSRMSSNQFPDISLSAMTHSTAIHAKDSTFSSPDQHPPQAGQTPSYWNRSPRDQELVDILTGMSRSGSRRRSPQEHAASASAPAGINNWPSIDIPPGHSTHRREDEISPKDTRDPSLFGSTEGQKDSYISTSPILPLPRLSNLSARSSPPVMADRIPLPALDHHGASTQTWPSQLPHSTSRHTESSYPTSYQEAPAVEPNAVPLYNQAYVPSGYANSPKTSHYLNSRVPTPPKFGYGTIQNVDSTPKTNLAPESIAPQGTTAATTKTHHGRETQQQLSAGHTHTDAVTPQSKTQRTDRDFVCVYSADGAPCDTAHNNKRKGFSDYFGRNKICTKAIPDEAWLYMCRQHYQRGRYRSSRDGQYARLKRNGVIQQTNKIELHMGAEAFPQHGPINWTLGFQRELATALQQAQHRHCNNQPFLLESEDAKVKSLMKQVKAASKVAGMIGENKTTSECLRFVQACFEAGEEVGLEDLLSIEMLPMKWGGHDFSRGNTGAKR